MVTIQNVARQNIPSIPFEKIAESVLGKSYDLSVVLCGERRIRNLNKKYRGKDNNTNILSFPISKNTGEIFLNSRQISKESPQFGNKIRKHFAYIFIHGLLHLKGFKHSSKMETEEQKILRRFGFTK